MTGVSAKVVLGATALVCSPAIVAAVRRTLPVDVALERCLVGLVVCWMAAGVVAAVWRHNEIQAMRRPAPRTRSDGEGSR